MFGIIGALVYICVARELGSDGTCICYMALGQVDVKDTGRLYMAASARSTCVKMGAKLSSLHSVALCFIQHKCNKGVTSRVLHTR